MDIPKRIKERLIQSLKKFQPIIESAKNRDINESDTVTITTDMLGDMFGYDKYSEITSEYAIRGTYCDLAVKLDGKISVLIEVKAIGIELKDNHLKQVVDYAANDGVEWVILTNVQEWHVYRILFKRPIEHEHILYFNILNLNPKNESHLEMLFLLTRDAIRKSALEDFHTQKQATNKFCLAAIILSDPVLVSIRREVRRVSPGVQIQIEDIKTILESEVFKREISGGEEFQEATKNVKRLIKKAQREKETAKAKQEKTITTSETTPFSGEMMMSQPDDQSDESHGNT